MTVSGSRMGMSDNSKFDLPSFRSKRALFFVFLLICVIVFSVSFVLILRSSGDSSLVDVAPPLLEDTLSVETGVQLKNAIYNAVNPTVISLDRDIVLTEQINIYANKNITLTSSNKVNLFKLIGADEHDTIYVETGGMLTLNGVIVTHNTGDSGRGVAVEEGVIFYDLESWNQEEFNPITLIPKP